MTNEADMLDAAAKKLRYLARGATPGRWESACVPNRIGDDGGDEGDWIVDAPTSFVCSTQIDTRRGETDAAYIAAMSPPVALALAELLSQVAGIVRQPPGVGRPDGPAGRTLAVARAILGPGWAMQRAAADLASIEQEDT